MKFLLFCILITSQAFAMSRERTIYDLQYVPEKSVAFGSSEFAYENYLGRDGSEDKFSHDSYTFYQTIGYAFTDNFLMSLGVNYLQRRVESLNEGTGLHYTKSGLSDPTFSFKYRLQDNFFRFDVLGGLLLNTGNSTYDGEDENNKVGGHRLHLGFNFGQKWELVQWSLLINMNRQFERTTDYGDGDTSKSRAYNFYFSELSGLVFLDNHVILKGFANITVSDPLGGRVRSTIYPFIGGSELQFLITENFLLRTGVAYKTFQVKDQKGYNSGFIYNLAANYQF